MTTDQLAKRIYDLGAKFGLDQIQRMDLVCQVLTIVREYQAALHRDVLVKLGRDQQDEMPLLDKAEITRETKAAIDRSQRRP